ncbi:MAG: NeuD/PglB/VioB family sugar acetyltransferase [Magnetospirillum sp. WYHS-4]
MNVAVACRLSCLIVGGGGHAKVVIDALRAAGAAERLGVIDEDRALAGGSVLGVPVLGGDAEGPAARAAGFGFFVIGVGANNDLRRRLFERALSWGIEPLSVIHPAAVVAPSATLGPGTVAFAGVVVNAEARVGSNAIVNTGAIVEHDCRVGDHVHVAPGARLLGGVSVGDLASIGAGAVIKHGVAIGAGAIVGAGAVVLEDVMSGIRVAGVPAQRLR